MKYVKICKPDRCNVMNMIYDRVRGNKYRLKYIKNVSCARQIYTWAHIYIYIHISRIKDKIMKFEIQNIKIII